MSPLHIIFFGTPDAARYVLEELLRAGVVPNMVVTGADERKGRGLLVTPPPVKMLAEQKGIAVFQPEAWDESALDIIASEKPDLFIVAAYGKLFPQKLIVLPRLGAINVHPSLLPKFRGASPVRDAILSGEKETGTSIMRMDEKMDHGPVIAQEKAGIEDVPKARELEERLMRLGGKMIIHMLPDLVRGKIIAVEQDHARATFTHKWKKEDGLVDIAGDPKAALRRIRACDGWPGAYFFTERNGKRVRVGIIDAHISDGKLVITRVLPEGRKEMDYGDFVRGSQK